MISCYFQVWVLEPYGDGDAICLRSHLNKYLAVDQFGNVTCENDEKGPHFFKLL